MLSGEWYRQPVAHRGLHDRARCVIENTPAAFEAAIAGGYGFECDVQEAADGEPMVFHDETLDRLMQASGPVKARTAAELIALPYKETSDRMLRLGDLLALVAGRTRIFLEIKSDWSGDGRFAARIARTLARYNGPIAAMSFDPDQLTAFRAALPEVPRGLIATRFRRAHWPWLNLRRRLYLTSLLACRTVKPQFLCYDIRHLPSPEPLIARKLGGLPLLAWTIRTEADMRRAARWADGIVFEGFHPSGWQARNGAADGR